MQLTRRPLGLSRGWLLACLRQLLIEFAVALPKKLLSQNSILLSPLRFIRRQRLPHIRLG
jgi:hypothetical protein